MAGLLVGTEFIVELASLIELLCLILSETLLLGVLTKVGGPLVQVRDSGFSACLLGL